jgi:hypothetical protein
MGGLFRLIEKLNLGFPKGKSGLSDKVRFEEKISYVLKSSNGDIIIGK